MEHATRDCEVAAVLEHGHPVLASYVAASKAELDHLQALVDVREATDCGGGATGYDKDPGATSCRSPPDTSKNLE